MNLSLLNGCTFFERIPADGSLNASYEFTAQHIPFKEFLFRANGLFNFLAPVFSLENEGRRHSEDLVFEMNADSLPFDPSLYWALISTQKIPNSNVERTLCHVDDQIMGSDEEGDQLDAFDKFRDMIREHLENEMENPVINTDPSIIILPDDDELLAVINFDTELALHLKDAELNKITFII